MKDQEEVIAQENQAYVSKSRANLGAALVTNLRETSTTAWYGFIGISGTVGTYFGQLNVWFTSACAALPLFSRWNETTQIAQDDKEVKQNRVSYYAMAGVRILIGATMLGIAALTATFASAGAAAWLVGAACVSKLLNMGDASPVAHLENLFRPKAIANPVVKGRENFFNSLWQNVTGTFSATFYSLVAISASNLTPAASFFKLTPQVAGVLAIVPLVTRLGQIEKMTPTLDDAEKKSYRAQAVVSTLMDVATGALVYTAATLAGVSYAYIVVSGLAGWAGAKLSSSGKNSPVELLAGQAELLAEKVTAKLHRSPAMQSAVELPVATASFVEKLLAAPDVASSVSR